MYTCCLFVTQISISVSLGLSLIWFKTLLVVFINTCVWSCSPIIVVSWASKVSVFAFILDNRTLISSSFATFKVALVLRVVTISPNNVSTWSVWPISVWSCVSKLAVFASMLVNDAFIKSKQANKSAWKVLLTTHLCYL